MVYGTMYEYSMIWQEYVFQVRDAKGMDVRGQGEQSRSVSPGYAQFHDIQWPLSLPTLGDVPMLMYPEKFLLS